MGILACVFELGAAVQSGTVSAGDHGRVPDFTGWVNDASGVLTMRDRERIADTLERYHLETHHQRAILIIPSLGEEQIGTFSLRTANTWVLGNNGYDDGILVTLAMKERRTRIELGRGMQRFISDADAKGIIDREMTLRFATGGFAARLELGLARLMNAGRRFVVPIDHSPARPVQP